MLLRDKGNFLFPSGHINGLHFFTERQIKKPTKAKPIGSHAVGIHINHITQHLLKYQTDLTDKQKLIVRASLPHNMTLPRKYDLCPVAFRQISPSLVGHIARYVPSSTCKICTNSHRPGVNKFCGMGSKTINIFGNFTVIIKDLFFVKDLNLY